MRFATQTGTDTTIIAAALGYAEPHRFDPTTLHVVCGRDA
jgi:hypothetical protein